MKSRRKLHDSSRRKGYDFIPRKSLSFSAGNRDWETNTSLPAGKLPPFHSVSRIQHTSPHQSRKAAFQPSPRYFAIKVAVRTLLERLRTLTHEPGDGRIQRSAWCLSEIARRMRALAQSAGCRVCASRRETPCAQRLRPSAPPRPAAFQPSPRYFAIKVAVRILLE
jgi:hypothetical protein